MCLCHASHVPLIVPKVVHHIGYPPCAILCLWFPSQGAVMCQVSYRKVPSCAKDAHRMVHPCAKLHTSRSHCVPILPIARCHRVPMFPICMSHNVLREVIAWISRVPSFPPPCAKVAKTRCHRVSSYPSQGAIACQVAHRKVPSRALCAYGSHRKVPSRALCAYGSHRNVSSCAKLLIERCHQVPMCPITCASCEQNCPSQGAIVCVLPSCHHVLSFPLQGAIMFQG